MSDFYKRIINGYFPEPSGTGSYWELVRDTNPAIYDLVKKEAESQNVAMTINQLSAIAASVITVLIGTAFKQATGVGALTEFVAASTVTAVKAAGSAAQSEITVISGGQKYTVETFIKNAVGVIAICLAEGAIGAIGLSCGLEFILVMGAGYTIPIIMQEIYDSYMDDKAIVKAQDDGSHNIQCYSNLNEFLDEKWDKVKDFKRWTLERIGSDSGLRLTFSKNENGKPPMTLETTQVGYPDPILFTTILNKIETDFNFKVGGAEPDYIYNFTHVDRADLVNESNKQYALFAMMHLAPFVPETLAKPYYSSIDPNNYSEKYLEDRANFFYYSMHPGESVYDDLGRILFEDYALKESNDGYNGKYFTNAGSVSMNQSEYRRYTFGSESGEKIEGRYLDDHLYGMGGNDEIIGGGGKDYIEGGQGWDIMDGGNGDDTFYVQGNDEAFDNFIGGDGNDIILGSKNDDTIRVHHFSKLDSGEDQRVEIIDGKEGKNTIAGTANGDIIDLSETELKNIQEINLGGGNDKLQMSEKKYDAELKLIDGGAGTDTLTNGTESWHVIDLTGLELKGIENIDATDRVLEIKLTNSKFDTIEKIEFGVGENSGQESPYFDISMSGAQGDRIDKIIGGDNVSCFDLTNTQIKEIGTIDVGDKYNTIDLSGAKSESIKELIGGTGQDTFTLNNTEIKSIDLIDLGDCEENENKLVITGGTIETISQIKGGKNDDTIEIKNGIFKTIDTLDLGDGKNTLTIEGVEIVIDISSEESDGQVTADLLFELLQGEKNHVEAFI